MLTMWVPLLLVAIILSLVCFLLFWQFKQSKNANAGLPWLESGHDLQLWLLLVAVVVAGMFFAYLLFVPVLGR